MPRQKKLSTKKNPVRKTYTRTYRKRPATRRPRREETNFGQGVGEALGHIAGTVATPFLGVGIGQALPKIGRMIGGGAQSLVRRITGYGDYKINVNTLMSSDPVPEFMSSGGRCTVLRHREFIQDVQAGALTGSYSQFTLNSWAINPGNADLFPWLSQVAQNYEQYRFQGLIFEFKTTSGSMSTTPMLGTVVMATQYNTLSSAFTNKQQMENYEFAGSTVPSNNLIHPIECDPRETQCNGIFNVVTNANYRGGDQRLYNLGTFNLATVGLPVAQEIPGELWVSYEVCLMKPRLNQVGASRADHWINSSGAGFNGTTEYFGTGAITSNSDNFITPSGTTITFDTSFYGKVYILYKIVQAGAIAAPIAPTFTGSNGATANNLFNNNTTNVIRPIHATNAIDLSGTYSFNIQPISNSTTPTITLAGGSFSTVGIVELIVIQIPDNFS